jgi:hypothetical protein
MKGGGDGRSPNSSTAVNTTLTVVSAPEEFYWEFAIVCDGDPFMDGTHERRTLGRFTSLSDLQRAYVHVVARSSHDPKSNLRIERRLVGPWEAVDE